MRNEFNEFFTPTEPEFVALWDKAIFSFDANVILNLIRFRETSRHQIISVLEKLGDRIWLSGRACEEFLANRHGVLNSLTSAYTQLRASIAKSDKMLLDEIETISKQFANREHPSIDFAELRKQAGKHKKQLNLILDRQEKVHPSSTVTSGIVDRISKLFEGKVGKRFNPAEQADADRNFKDRVAKEVRPGLRDTAKPDGGIGDYIIWLQLIDQSKKKKRPIIFVTDDKKDDWWLIVNGKTVGPHPDLRREFFEKAGQTIYFYTTSEFLTFAQKRGTGDISKETLAEIKSEEQAVLDRTRFDKHSHVAKRNHYQLILNYINREKLLQKELANNEALLNSLREKMNNADDLNSFNREDDRLFSDALHNTTKFSRALDVVRRKRLNATLDYKLAHPAMTDWDLVIGSKFQELLDENIEDDEIDESETSTT